MRVCACTAHIHTRLPVVYLLVHTHTHTHTTHDYTVYNPQLCMAVFPLWEDVNIYGQSVVVSWSEANVSSSDVYFTSNGVGR